MTEEVLHRLSSIVGDVIRSVRRIHYVVRNSPNLAVGALELEFTDGSVLFLDSAGDGESLRVSTEAWPDPFAEDRLTPENREYVARSGKWTRFDVSREPLYAHLVGAAVEAIEPIASPSGKIVGAVLRTTAGDIRADVEADDLYVQVG
jgi:hypothetical protein